MNEPITDNQRTLPLWKNTMEKLLENAAFGYNYLITFEFLERELSEKRDTVAFNFALIPLRQAMKLEGYLLTADGTNGEGLRVATREEMAKIIKGQEFHKINHTMNSHLCLTAVNTSGMDSEDIKKLEHWRDKTGLTATVCSKLLRMREIPTAEMAIKSLKQIR